MTDIKAVLTKAQPRQETARLCLRGDLIHQHKQLVAELTEAERLDEMSNEPDLAPEIAQQIVDLEAEIRAEETEFTFRSIGRRAWSDLMAKYPPSKAEQRIGAEFNEDFIAAAVAASCVDPAMTDEEARQLEELVTVGQWSELWQACVLANGGTGSVGESKAASRVLASSKPSSTSAIGMESPEASS